MLGDMPVDCPPIVIAQHMPAGFTTRFAARLDELSDISVVEAEDRMPLEPGNAYVARGDWHLRVERSSRPAQMPADAGRADLGPPPQRRCAVRIGGQDRRADGGRRDPDRHGPRRRPRARS